MLKCFERLERSKLGIKTAGTPRATVPFIYEYDLYIYIVDTQVNCSI